MPSATLPMPNGRDPVTGISFRKVKEDNSKQTNGDQYKKDAHDDIPPVNGLNGVEQEPSNSEKDQPGVDAIRMRLKKGRKERAGNRNGCVFESRPGIPMYNNNGPIKAFPLNGNGTHGEIDRNANNSSLPNSSSDLSSLNSSSSASSVPESVRISSPRPPLQRINGRGPQKQRLPPGLTDPFVPKEPYDRTVKVQIQTEIDDAVPDAKPPNKALNAALLRNGSGTSLPFNVMHRETVTFAEYNLPPGMKELCKECFVPGVKGCFQQRTDIPLLISTDAAILKRKSSISQNKRNRIPTPTQTAKSRFGHHTLKNDESSSMARSRSTASEGFIQPDLEILKACWNIILSFMGDDKPSLMKPHRTIKRLISPRKKKLWRKSSADIIAPKSFPMPSPTMRESGIRPISMFVMQGSTPGSPKPKKTTDKPLSSAQNGKKLPPSVSGLTIIEKVHVLVNAGLKLPYLRDEIYCLIMKQLVSNPTTSSTALGWILFALLTGTFPPSQKILTYVEKFIDHHDHAWSKYCTERLKRTVKNGPRANPPCSLEIQAAKSAKQLTLPIICMDSSAMTVSVDPATTSKEMLESLTVKNRIGDSFGYCIILQSKNQIVNLGSGRFPIMDALSQVEMSAGKKFSKETCKIFYRRDIFSPRDLFCAIDDSMALRMTFYQVCGGIKSGEYFCKKAPDLALLIAHQYCIRHGLENFDERRVSKFCEKCLPSDIFKSDKKNWCRMVVNTLSALRRKLDEAVNSIDIMAQVIRYTMQNLTQHFVRKYSIMTFSKVNGVCTYTSELSLSLSHEGVTVRQGDAVKIGDHSSTEEAEVLTVPVVLMEIPAANLKKVKLETRGLKSGTTLTITDCVGGSYEITSAHGPEIYSVLFRYIRDITTGANKESKA